MKKFSFPLLTALISAMLFFSACQTNQELVQPDLTNSDTVDLDNPPPDLPFSLINHLDGEKIQYRMVPMYETRGISGTSPLDFCKVVIDAIKFTNGQTVSFNAVIMQNNAVDPVACQALVEAIKEKLFEFYEVCYEVQLHASITTDGPTRTMRWYLCIGDISSGSVVDDVTSTVVNGPCNTPFIDTNTYTFFEDTECAPFEYQYVSTGCVLPVYERISWSVVAGFGNLYWTDMRVKWIKTSDGTIYNMDVPLLSSGLEVFNADATLAQIFQQAVYDSYNTCYDSRAEFLVQEQAFAIYLGLGDINPATTLLDSFGFWVRANNGVTYNFKGNIWEHNSPGQFVVLDQTCP